MTLLKMTMRREREKEREPDDEPFVFVPLLSSKLESSESNDVSLLLAGVVVLVGSDVSFVSFSSSCNSSTLASNSFTTRSCCLEL